MAMRPDLTAAQHAIKSCFYSARRDAPQDQKITCDKLTALAADICYEQDLAVWIMQRLDDHLGELIAIKRKQEAKSNGR